MKKRIIKELDTIEQTHGVQIIYACESGSRAWGFASKDSDYDVRFIYAHPTDWYLSIAERRDVIEIPVSAELDISGWDIRKSLRLLRKSNSPLLEWLSSPIVYKNVEAAVGPLLALSQKAFLPESSCHHYLSMARSSIAKFQNEQDAKIKSYLYAARTILCCKWIIERMSHPPMRIQDLLTECLPTTGKIRDFVDALIELKGNGTESIRIERSHDFEDYMNEEFKSLEAKIPKNPEKIPIKEFDSVFKDILEQITKQLPAMV
ncbi:MAG: nucleotidyltransferase domain-containing protein [Desulfobacterales bacterium]|nr:nucleotidyltransferase domain-containing protein [Desulfobacterales bacterium]